jgi:hypothetical protein
MECQSCLVEIGLVDEFEEELDGVAMDLRRAF